MSSSSSMAEEVQASFAVVTGANKGIGLEIARQLALKGVAVVLTARDKKRGTDAVESLRQSHGLSKSNLVFHQLDVRDQASIASLAEFIRTEFGKLDILVNNAGVSGIPVERLTAVNIDPASGFPGKTSNLVQGVVHQTYDDAVICFDTNFYGCRRVTEALLPLLKLSTSGAKIVNVSSRKSALGLIPNEMIRHELNDIDNLNEERIERLIDRFLGDLKNGRLEANEWRTLYPSYRVSKAVLNAYTRLLAKRHPSMRINCVHPGFVKTDMTRNNGDITAEEGAKGPVMLALLGANDGPTGGYFNQTSLAEF